jgi:hypothetical protein
MPAKKYTVVERELDIVGRGCYCIFPWDKLDDKGKGLFKVGMTASSFRRRLDDFHTAFPGDSWMVGFLSFPLHASAGEYFLSRQESGEARPRFLEIETYIMR